MKKLIRVFIIVFCLFFVLQALPGSFLHTIRKYTLKIPEYMAEATLRLAESIDDLLAKEESDSREPGTAEEKSDISTLQKTDENEAAGQNEENSSDLQKADDTGAEEEAFDDSSPSESDSSLNEDADAGAREAAGTPEEDAVPDVFYYYYTRISREERLLYDAMLALAQNYSADPVSESRLLDTNPSTDEFAESYTRAYNALVRDHPELFWIAQSKVQYECKYYLLPSFGGKYKVVLTLSDTDGQQTVNEDGLTIYQQEQARLEEAADALLAVPVARMHPDGAIIPQFENGQIPADHRDLGGMELPPVQKLGRLPGAAGGGEQPGAPVPQDSHRVEQTAAILLQEGARRQDQGLVLGVVFRVALRHMRQRPRDKLRRGFDVVFLAIHGLEPEFEVLPGAGIQKGIAHRMTGVFCPVNLFHDFLYTRNSVEISPRYFSLHY